MRITATYTKNGNGTIRVTLSCVKNDDYPHKGVFLTHQVWNKNKIVVGVPGNIDVVVLDSIEGISQARTWVATQIAELKKQLDEWRSIEISKDQDFEI